MIMGVDTSFYVQLDSALDRQDQIVLDRNATDRKMQSVAVKSFIFWNNRFEAISQAFLSRKANVENVTDRQLDGEKNLARLRFFSRFWKGNARRVENLNFNSSGELKKEKERITIAIKRLETFRQELGGEKLNVDSIDHKLTDKDEKAFKRLSEAIETLQAKVRVIDKVQHSLTGVKSGNWNIAAWLKSGIEETLHELEDKSKLVSRMTPVQLKRYREELHGSRGELLSYAKAGIDINAAVARIDVLLTNLPRG